MIQSRGGYTIRCSPRPPKAWSMFVLSVEEKPECVVANLHPGIKFDMGTWGSHPYPIVTNAMNSLLSCFGGTSLEAFNNMLGLIAAQPMLAPAVNDIRVLGEERFVGENARLRMYKSNRMTVKYEHVFVFAHDPDTGVATLRQTFSTYQDASSAPSHEECNVYECVPQGANHGATA